MIITYATATSGGFGGDFLRLLPSPRKVKIILFLDFFAAQTNAATAIVMATPTNTARAADTETATVTTEELFWLVVLFWSVVVATGGTNHN